MGQFREGELLTKLEHLLKWQPHSLEEHLFPNSQVLFTPYCKRCRLSEPYSTQVHVRRWA